MATQTASSSSSREYDVFLSFCGVDTRHSFTDHLYFALKQKHIITFRDDEKLERGKYISPELLRAIEESKYAIVVLSRNYAFSRWCLIELARIVECIEETKLTVLPVFYHVDPSHVRNQTGTLAKAFAKHEKDPRVNAEEVQAWKAALKAVGNISGWHVNDRHESIVIQEILKRIFIKVNLISQNANSMNLVGMESRVTELLDLLNEGSSSVRFVGICGMGGMGKTTLAQEIYNRIYCNFEATRFISIVKETKNQDLVSFQKQLLSMALMESEINIWNVSEGIIFLRSKLCNKKVLIVLDDVVEIEQLEALAGKDDWFGLGSRIIVTTRNKHLLKCHGVGCVYTTMGLSRDEALELFSWKAFKKSCPDENFMDLSMDFVSYAQGLPLALKVLGSSLCGRGDNAWRSARDKLKEEPDRDIQNVLKISYDGLKDREKELFLDIACLFKGEKKDCIRDILESFGYYPDCNIDILIDKSLITIDEEGSLWMHDLLQKMGQEIVRSQSPGEPGGRSRLWMYEDVLHVLKKSTGTEAVEVIMLTYNQREEHLDANVFSKMKKMRLLKICNVQFPQGLSYLSDELRVIEWLGYPLKSMPTCFQPNKLVELRMQCSSIEHLWKEIIILNMLKLIDLSDSQNLIEIPNLTGAPNLKQLILQGCTRLPKIHASVGNLKQLIQLDLNGCKCLESLPQTINLESLEVFILSGCSRLKKFPEVVGKMSCLLELYLNETAINDLPLSMEHLTGLIKLDLRDCKNLSSLPNACCSSMSLKVLTLSGCSKLDELPENLGNLKGLEELDVSGTAIKGLPKSINLLKNLRLMSFHGCEEPSPKSSNKFLGFPLIPRRSTDPMGMLMHDLSGLCSLIELDLSYCNLQTIPDVIGYLSSLLKLDLKGNNFVYLPKSMIRLSNLKVLCLIYCMSLRSLPKLPLNIKYIHARGCTSLETLSLGLDDDFWPTLYLLNCIKLMENQGYNDLSSTMLKRYILNNQRYFDQDRLSYGFEIPGSEIPKWFSHQNVEASVNLHVHSHLCKEFMGIAVCVVFGFCRLYPLDELCSIDDYGYYRATQRLWCSVKANGFAANRLYLPLSEEFGNIKSYQLWLEYYPSTFFGDEWTEELNQVGVNGCSQIEVTFETEGPGLEVTKCGAHLVFKQDVEDLKQTMVGSSSCSINPYEDDLDDSGEDTSNDMDVPHSKWILILNLIHRFILHLRNWFGK